MKQSKWHNISIKTESFNELQVIQNKLPIRASIPQTIEWLIKVGQTQLMKSELDDQRKQLKII